jgi:hypothetical protein
VKWSKAKAGHGIGRGICFTVLSANEYGGPGLVYRTDGDTPILQNGLGQLNREINEVFFEEPKKGTKHPLLEMGEKLLSRHPNLFFGTSPGGFTGSTYEIGIEVRTDWWDKIEDRPTDIECHRHSQTGSLYIVLAHLPYAGLDEDSSQLLQDESLQDKKAALERYGWRTEREDRDFDALPFYELKHKYFVISRQPLSGRSVVRDGEHGKAEIPTEEVSAKESERYSRIALDQKTILDGGHKP